jgi:nucleotide-binding universal stress UspA family protein/vacuolar-type H+-ATPase subunit F/Vma7
VGGTIFTDTVVLLILAVILGNSKGYLNEKFFIRLISSLTIFMGIMTFLVPKISKWFFQKLEGEKHAHYIYVLLIVFTSALLSEIAGLEPIIGAFVAGLVLNRLIPASSALMNRIEFIGNSLFIPFFLISVGMLVDLKILLNGPQALIVAGTLIIVSLVGKWAAAFFTQITFRYSTNQRKLIFGLSSAHAAATLAIILVGYKNNIIDENILNGTIVLILITCIVASFVTEKAAKAILQEDEGASYELDIHSSLNDEHILLPVANTANLDKLLEFALLIKDKKSVNPVTILSVVPNNEEAEVNIQKSKKKLEEFVKLGASSEIKVNTISTIDHNAANGIVRVSRELVSDLIIMGWPQKAGLIERIIGEKIPSIIDNVDKQLFICRLHESFVSHNLIKIFNLPFAEKEKGFSLWVWKISMLSLELGIPVVHYGTSKTQKAIQAELSRRNINIIISYKVMESPEDFLEKIVEENELDLVIFISARKGALSYHSSIESIPAQLENKWKGNIVIVYP